MSVKNTCLNLVRMFLLGFFLAWVSTRSIYTLSAQTTILANTLKKPFKIKGFYIGMTRNLVHTELNRQKIEYSDSADHTACAIGDGLQIVFFYDEKDQLFELDINPRAVDQLFNVSNLSVNDFMSQFKQAYHLPDMELVNLPRLGTVWKYKNEDEGFEVLICIDNRPYTQANKKLILGRIPLKSQRKFD